MANLNKPALLRALHVATAVFFVGAVAHDLNVYFRMSRDADFLSLLVGEREPYLFKYVFALAFLVLAIFRMGPPKAEVTD